MSAWDDLIVRAAELKLNGAAGSSHEAAEQVVKANPSLVTIAAIEQLFSALRSRDRKDWKWAGEHFDQLTMFVGDDRYQVPDRPVRFINEQKKEDFKPRRWANSEEAMKSFEAKIRLHVQEAALAEREHTLEKQTQAALERHGFDSELPWDEIRHRDTICHRCKRGYDRDDPFVIGHKISAVQGGQEIGWEHHSCNSSARANPVPNLSEDDEDSEDG
jgi:hypothetical protein